MIGTKQEAKRRLMFIQKEDYNFLTYNILLLLKLLGATSSDSKFQDYKKIAYLIQFIAKPHFNSYSNQDLGQVYVKSHLKKQLISHLVLILKNKNLIGVYFNVNRNSLDIWLIEENIPTGFFDGKLFENEINNIKILKIELPRLKILTLKTMVDTIFTKNKVITWEI